MSFRMCSFRSRDRILAILENSWQSTNSVSTTPPQTIYTTECPLETIQETVPFTSLTMQAPAAMTRVISDDFRKCVPRHVPVWQSWRHRPHPHLRSLTFRIIHQHRFWLLRKSRFCRQTSGSIHTTVCPNATQPITSQQAGKLISHGHHVIVAYLIKKDRSQVKRFNKLTFRSEMVWLLFFFFFFF